MGDRGNIALDYGPVDGQRVIYLYTHWSGSVIPQYLSRALEFGTDRWNDPSYLARIIFDGMGGRQLGDTTGFGIDVEIGDGDVEATVYLDAQKVEVADKFYTFAEFVKAFRDRS